MAELPSLADIAKRVRERRTAEGLSQKELAELVGVHHATIVALEKGEGNLRLVNAWRVLEALGLADPSAGRQEIRNLEKS
jgi:transcriptional regulator with XRE-family HTH domain